MLRYVPAMLLGLMLAEIAGFVWVGDRIGALMVILLVVLSAIVGAGLIRREGVNAATTLRAALRGGAAAAPAPRLFAILAGVLLILPGFLSDVAALLLLLPPVSRFLAARLSERVLRGRGTRPPGSGMLIEGEAAEIADPPGTGRSGANPSPWRR